MNATEHFYHRWVIPCGVASHTFQCVDAADPDVELVGAKLLDSLGVAVSHLPLLGQLECAPRQGVVLRGEDQAPRRRTEPAPRVSKRPRALSSAVA